MAKRYIRKIQILDKKRISNKFKKLKNEYALKHKNDFSRNSFKKLKYCNKLIRHSHSNLYINILPIIYKKI